MENKVSIGERLKNLRIEAKLSQSEVAKLCFIARTTYAQYETNVAYPPQEVQILLSRFYKVSLDYLNGLTDFKTNSSFDSNLSDSDQQYKSIPLLSLPSLTPIRQIKTLYEKVQRGPFCYLYSPSKFSEYNINKNNLLLIKRTSNFKLGDLLLIEENSLFYIGRYFNSENKVILYSSDFDKGFKEFTDNYSVIGKIVEVTISI